MGVVERVKDQVLKREVALKRIKFPSGSTQRLVKAQRIMLWRFRREASITAILEHPNIIPLHDMEEKASGELFFTMCKVEGETLTKKLRQKRDKHEDLEEHKILEIYMKVCNAISYAHSRGVIHRDLKPDNIMIGKFGEVYVMDWGIAKLIHETDTELENETNSATESVNSEGMKTIGGMGTPGYMAPEQAENAALVTLKSDIYALGKILRECYTLLSPYEELMQRQKTERALKKIKKSASKKKINKQEEEIPKDILAIINKATHESLEERYSNVQEIFKDIEAYLNHREVSAKNYSIWELGIKWILRNKQKILITFFVVLISLGLFGYSWFEKKRKNHKKIEEALYQSNAILQESKDSSKDFNTQGERIQRLLDAFTFLNNVLGEADNITHYEMNKEKEKLGKKLIQVTLEREEYEFANYILQEIQNTETIPPKAKQEIEKLITEDSILAKHIKRFDDLMKKLENIKTKSDIIKRGTFFLEKEERIKEEQVNAIILEISKMKEPEIFEKLLVLLEKGNQYFLKDTESLSYEEMELHRIRVQILGKLANPNSGKFLYNALKQIMEKKIIPKTIEHKLTLKELAELSYAVALAEALSLANKKEFSYLEPFETLIDQLHPESLFLKRTERAYIKLLSSFEKLNESLETKEAYFKRGKMKSKQKEFQGAIDDFNKAVEIDPQYAEAYNARAEVYILIKTETDITPTLEECETSRKDFAEAIRLKPDFLEAYYNRGKFLKLIPKNSETSLEPQKRFAEALADVQEVLRLDPKHQKAYLLRAEIFYGRQEYSKFFEDIDTLLKLNPQSSDAYALRGGLQYLRKFEGDIQNALVDYKEILRLFPESYGAWNALATVQYMLGNQEEASFCIERSIQGSAHLKVSYLTRAKIRAAQKDKEGALADMDQVVSLEPDNGADRYERGLVKMRFNLLDEALEDFNMAIEMKTGNAFIFLNRGRLLFYHKKNKAGAKADFIIFLEMTKGDDSPVIIKFREDLIKEFPILAQFR